MVSKKTKDLIVGGVAIGAGSLVLSRFGGTAATHAQTGLTNVSGFFPVIGTTIGAGLTLKTLDMLPKPKKKKGGLL